MYAVVRTGGKQYRIEPGTVFNIERLEGEAVQTIDLTEVLLLSNGEDIKVGTPLVSGARVQVEIVEQKRGPKLVIFKKIRRHGKRVKKGHRQELTRVKVKEILQQA
jgi:large subunit ribosomal protein L21